MTRNETATENASETVTSNLMLCAILTSNYAANNKNKRL